MRTIKQLLITVAVLLCSITANAHDFEVDGIFYNISGDEAIVTYKGSSPSAYSDEYSGYVIIPKKVTYNGTTYSVTSIGGSAFYYCTRLNSIKIPNSVTRIGDEAFSDCHGLTSVTIPNSVTSIGDYAFRYCTSLASIVIPNSVTSIGPGAFVSCKRLTSITIPNSVTSIGNSAFYYCSGLTSITIGNGVTSIEESAFYDCSSLRSVTIGNSVTSIGPSAFSGCSGLTSIVIPNSVTSIGDHAFRNCTSLASIVIPNSVTSIGPGAFSNCTGLTSIEIPNSVTRIGDKAFFYCSSLTSITIGNSVTSIGDYAFCNCFSLTSIVIPNSVTSIEESAFSNCTSLTSITIPNSVTSIGDNAFDNCYYIKEVVLGDNVTSIGKEAFKGCSGIKKISLMGTTPPAVGSNNFTNAHFINSTVYVPKGTLAKYQSADIWKDFCNIQEYYLDKYFYVNYIVDGETYATDSVKHGDTIILKENPTKDGFTFSGWSEAPETMPAHDITIEGVFNVNYHAVTYIVDGEVWATDSLAYGSEIVLRDEPTKEGYTFSGWSEAPETMPAKDISIEGTFYVNNYTVTYIIDGEVYEEATVEYGAVIELPSVPKKDGYTFSGWKNFPETMPAKDIIIQGSYIADTAIEDIYLDLENIEVYNLKGVRITETDKLTRGIYIINGNKTFVK